MIEAEQVSVKVECPNLTWPVTSEVCLCNVKKQQSTKTAYLKLISLSISIYQVVFV
jgi:hypothetical protein